MLVSLLVMTLQQYQKENPKKNRPLSPHLQIYAWQMTSVLSILHRFTGVALAFGTLLLVYWLVALSSGRESYQVAMGFINSWFGILMIAGWTFAFYYHLLNGIRHLLWDSGYALDLPDVYRTGWVVVLGTPLLAVVTLVLVFL